MVKSEIRLSQIEDLLEKVRRERYSQYLRKITMVKLRGFEEQIVSFDFPVTALIGPNGGGKTTILGAAGCVYLLIKPHRFFAKSGSLDSGMEDWKIEYELIEKSLRQNGLVHRTASFHKVKWNRDAITRQVAVFGVSRTVPATERKELLRCATVVFHYEPNSIRELESPVKVAVQRILGKSMEGYSLVRVDERGRVTLLKGQTEDGKNQYSEFHFGAGESSIIRMVMSIEILPDYSLILIEEIENGLHPVATVRMVDYLIEVAERKKIQSIFTTHSNDALVPLPDEGIWTAIGNKVIQGKLDINSLRVITGQINARLAIFTEDVFAKDWVLGILRTHGTIAIDAVEVHALGGDGTAVKLNKFHNMDPSRTFPSICLIDGNSLQSESAGDDVYRLPGGLPESFIFNGVMEKIDDLGAKLTVACQLPYEQHSEVIEKLKEIQKTNREPHLIYSTIGERLGLIPESIIRGAFISIWANAYPQIVEEIISRIDSSLPKIS